MATKIVPDPVSQQSTLRLKKLAALQGFVTEAQIEEIAPSPVERERVTAFLSTEKIPINQFSKERKHQVGERRRQFFSERRAARYTDPTWVHLKTVG
ncbi:MAG: hypothetical protein PHC61_13085, partial [Chitinivibrionales bacterium]|nr:hypothetical protein [Chitinivibrionales bacterium]